MNDFAKHIGRTHPVGDIEMLQVQKFNDGWVCMFTVTTSRAVEHRVAYLCRGSANGVPYTIWDNVA